MNGHYGDGHYGDQSKSPSSAAAAGHSTHSSLHWDPRHLFVPRTQALTSGDIVSSVSTLRFRNPKILSQKVQLKIPSD